MNIPTGSLWLTVPREENKTLQGPVLVYQLGGNKYHKLTSPTLVLVLDSGIHLGAHAAKVLAGPEHGWIFMDWWETPGSDGTHFFKQVDTR